MSKVIMSGDQCGVGEFRTERDMLGTMELPANSAIGIHTARSLENFRISGRTLGQCRLLVRNLALVKNAAARANGEISALDAAVAGAIVATCEEIAAGEHHDHLVCDILEGSGATSVNMNMNEVIANLALDRLGCARGDYSRVHPNDHVNLGQSTNDVVPTATRLAIYDSGSKLVRALQHLASALRRKAEEHGEVLRLGRTCLQDAQPMTFGQTFGSYAAAVERHSLMLDSLLEPMLTIPLGGTAIGTGFGMGAGYWPSALHHLSALTGRSLQAPADFFDAMQNADDLARVSAEVRLAANLLWKIGNDFIILASGPDGGLGEIQLPRVQAGSSIMPGKVNPVLPMTLCQVALAVNGNDVAVSLAAQQGYLDLNHYELLIADRLLDSMAMIEGAVLTFTSRCVENLLPDARRSWDHLRHSSALATVLVPKLGYAAVSRLVEDAQARGRSFIDHAVAEGHLQADDVKRALLDAATRSRD